MKKYKVNKKHKICSAVALLIIASSIYGAIKTNDVKLLPLLLFSATMVVLGILVSFRKPIVYINGESVSVIPLMKITKRSIKYQDIHEVVFDEFLDLFSLVYLFPKEKRWRKGVAIHSSIENYKDSIKEILSHLPSTTWVDPEVYKFLNAKPKTIKEQWKRIGYVSMIAVIIFLIIMIAAILLTHFKIHI